MVSEMFEKAIQFLKDHKEVAFATSEGNFPKLRIFQKFKDGKIIREHGLPDMFSLLMQLGVIPAPGQ